MQTFKGVLDYIGYNKKPSADDAAQIQQRIKNESTIVDLPIEQWLEEIKLGKTVRPVVFDKYKKFVSQQLFFVDVDNSNGENIIDFESLIDISKKNGLSPIAIYESFSSSKTLPKYRIIYATQDPIINAQHATFITETILEIIPQTDRVTKDLSRIFYGTDGTTKKCEIIDPEARISLDEIIHIHDNISSAKKEKTTDNLEKLVMDFDLLGYMSNDNEITKDLGDKVYFKTCSICGHQDCLRYYKNSNSFYCFGSNGSLGGTIIDYLMVTKGFNKKAAIDYFKYDLLGLEKSEKKTLNIPEIEKHYLGVIKKQLKDNGIPNDEIQSLDWLEFNPGLGGKLNCSVDCPVLANVIRNNLHYLVVRDKFTNSVIQYVYLDGCYRLQSDSSFKGIIKLYIPIEFHKTSKINEVYNLLSTDLSGIPMDKLNSDENIINFQNGILNLKTGEMMEHSPKYLSTIQLPLEYKEFVEHPSTSYFDNFINDITKGNKDVQKLLLQFVGVALSNVPGYRMKKALFLIGKGNTGKTQLRDFCIKLLGNENCSQVELKDLENQYTRVDLLNKRFAGSPDMKYLNISSLDTFKQITGGDFISANIKYGPIISFKFKGLLWMNANDFMNFGGDRGDHVYERMVIVKCDNVIPEEKRNSYLVECLLEEKEYIISLAIKELLNVINNGYKYDIPECCKEVNRQFQVDNNSWLSFMQECTEDRNIDDVIPTDAATKGTIFKVYKEYCKDNNSGHFEKKSEVKKMLIKLGKDGEIFANGGNIYYEKFRLNNKTMEEYHNITNYCSGLHVDEFKKVNGLSDDDDTFNGDLPF